MRTVATGLVLLGTTFAVAAGAYNGIQNGLAQGQTTSPVQCHHAQEAFLACALKNDFNATSNTWYDASAASCYTQLASAFVGCRGGFALEVDGQLSTFPTFGYPSFAYTGGVSKAGEINAQVLIPTGLPPSSPQTRRLQKIASGLTKENTYKVTCKTCVKLMQKVLKCALPVQVGAGDPFQAYFAAVDACLTTPRDRVNFGICTPQPASELVPNAQGQLSYVVAASSLNTGLLQEACNSVEGSVNAKGGKSAKVLKSPISGGFI